MMQIHADPAAHAAITAELQSILRTNPRFKLEFLAAMSRLFREHDIVVEPEVLAGLTLSLNGGSGPSSRGNIRSAGEPHDFDADGPPPRSIHDFDADGPPPRSIHDFDADGPPPRSIHDFDVDGPPPRSIHDFDVDGPPPRSIH